METNCIKTQKKPRSEAQKRASRNWFIKKYYWKKSKQKQAQSQFDSKLPGTYDPERFQKAYSSSYPFTCMREVYSEDELDELRQTALLLENIIDTLRSKAKSWQEVRNIYKSYIGDWRFYVTSMIEYNYPIKRSDFDNMDPLDKECRMTMKDFVASCKAGGFVDSDGEGVYATEDKVLRNLSISPSQVNNNWHRKDFKYVCWYNK